MNCETEAPINSLWGLWDYFDSWGETIDDAIWYNDLNVKRRSHMHSYMSMCVTENLWRALDAGLQAKRFTVDQISGFFDEWLGNPNTRGPTDRAALETIAHWEAWTRINEARLSDATELEINQPHKEAV